jgi:hypothetical protein
MLDKGYGRIACHQDVLIKLGLGEGQYSEILEGELKANDHVLVGRKLGTHNR